MTSRRWLGIVMLLVCAACLAVAYMVWQNVQRWPHAAMSGAPASLQALRDSSGEWAELVRGLHTEEAVYDLDVLMAPESRIDKAGRELRVHVSSMRKLIAEDQARLLVSISGQYLAQLGAQRQAVDAYRTALSAMRNSDRYVPSLSAVVSHRATELGLTELAENASRLPSHLATLVESSSASTRASVEHLFNSIRASLVSIDHDAFLRAQTEELARHVEVVLRYEPDLREAYDRAVSRTSDTTAQSLGSLFDQHVSSLSASLDRMHILGYVAAGCGVLFLLLGVFCLMPPRVRMTTRVPKGVPKSLVRRVSSISEHAADQVVGELLPASALRDRVVLQHTCLASAEQLRYVASTYAGVLRCLSELANGLEAATTTGGRLRVSDCEAGARAVHAHAVRLKAVGRLNEAVAYALEAQRGSPVSLPAVPLGRLAAEVAHDCVAQRPIALEIQGEEVALSCGDPLFASVALGAVIDNAVQVLERTNPREPRIRVLVDDSGVVRVLDNSPVSSDQSFRGVGVPFVSGPGGSSGGLGLARARALLGEDDTAVVLRREGSWTCAIVRVVRGGATV